MNGRSGKGTELTNMQLNERHTSFVHLLRQNALPTEPPTATDAAAAAVAAASEVHKRAKPTPAKPTPKKPVFAAAPPGAAVLTVDLKDVSCPRQAAGVHERPWEACGRLVSCSR
jgi:hypothetical protein